MVRKHTGSHGRNVSSTLPGGWWHNEGVRDTIHDQIRDGIRAGTPYADIAITTGVARRTVVRMAARMRETTE